MNIFRRSFIFILLLLPLLIQAQLSVMTYNIRYNNPDDKENAWEERKQDVLDMIAYYAPDILGIQEGLYDQVAYLDEALEAYTYVGVGRDDGENSGEFTAIFYSKEKLTLIQTQTYWLSETPNRVSVGWDASMERITTFAEFEDRNTKARYHVFNCHFDHRGPKARENSAKLIVEYLETKQLVNKQVIVMGDLNCSPNDAPIDIFKKQLDDSHDISASKSYGPIGTWCSFKTDVIPENRIDYILTKNLKVLRYAHIDDRRPNNLNLSDHLAVFIDIE